MSAFLELVRRRPVLLDGGLGTELMKRGLPAGDCPELWNIERPDAVRDVHRAYFAAGSDAVSTNSFGGTSIRLAGCGLEGRAHELSYAAARLADEVRPEGRFVAGSLGPTGKFLKPQGEFDEDQFAGAFAAQALALAMGKVDVIIIETMFDLREALCAARGARRGAAGLPVLAAMTFSRTKRGFSTMMGDGVAACVRALEDEGVSGLGANCTLGSGDMADLVAEIRAATSLPVIAQANAGQPVLVEGQIVYAQTAEEFAADGARMFANGANIVGGCCGTTPEFIKRLAAAIKPRG